MKKFKFLILIISVVLLFGCTTEDSDSLKFKEEYESLNGVVNDYGKENRKLSIPKNNPFIYKTASEIVDMIDKKESFVVYFGFSSCPWCRSVIPSLIEAASDLNYNAIYYVDVKDIRNTLELDDNNEVSESKKGSESYYKLLEVLSAVLKDYNLTDKDGNTIETGQKRIYAPSVVSIINGKAEELETGISSLQTDPYMELSDEMKSESYNAFKCVIKCVSESKSACSLEKSC